MEGIKEKIQYAKQKAEKERKVVEELEKKQSEAVHPKYNNNLGVNSDSETVNYDTTKDDQERQKHKKTLGEMKRDTKAKKFELEKLFIELHEKDKENRLLILKVKELERIVPQNRLNPMSRDKSLNPMKHKRKMKNSSIQDANKSVLVTKKEQRLRQLKARNKSPDLKQASKTEKPPLGQSYPKIPSSIPEEMQREMPGHYDQEELKKNK